MSNTITLELPNSGHGCDICRHQDKDGLVWGSSTTTRSSAASRSRC